MKLGFAPELAPALEASPPLPAAAAAPRAAIIARIASARWRHQSTKSGPTSLHTKKRKRSAKSVVKTIAPGRKLTSGGGDGGSGGYCGGSGGNGGTGGGSGSGGCSGGGGGGGGADGGSGGEGAHRRDITQIPASRKSIQASLFLGSTL